MNRAHLKSDSNPSELEAHPGSSSPVRTMTALIYAVFIIIWVFLIGYSVQA